MKFYTSDKDGNSIEVEEEVILPEATKEQIDALPWGPFREKRNSLLAETDWWANSDLTMSADQTAYRKALRDLPSTATPSLDSDGQLTGVTWPEKP